MIEPNTDGIVRVVVLADCSHWWRESRPAEAKLTSPRPCVLCPPTVSAAVAVSDQGLPLVPVRYLPADVLDQAVTPSVDGVRS
jgi:hypothetical protein